MELLKSEPNCFRLAAFIAFRSRWREGFNAHGLGQGECFLGDFRNYGMTEKEYRGAKQKLEKWGFAAFKRAGKGRMSGTIARLVNTLLFDTTPPQRGGQKGGQGGGSRADVGRIKGGKQNLKEVKNYKEEGKGASATPTAFEIPSQEDVERSSSEPAKAKREIPDLAAVKSRAAELGMSANEAETFFHHYEANGWRVGKNPIVKWRAALAGWKSRAVQFAATSGRGAGTLNAGKSSQYRGIGRVADRNAGTANAGADYSDMHEKLELPPHLTPNGQLKYVPDAPSPEALSPKRAQNWWSLTDEERARRIAEQKAMLKPELAKTEP
jgi:hypothetical protein